MTTTEQIVWGVAEVALRYGLDFPQVHAFADRADVAFVRMTPRRIGFLTGDVEAIGGRRPHPEADGRAHLAAALDGRGSLPLHEVAVLVGLPSAICLRRTIECGHLPLRIARTGPAYVSAQQLRDLLLERRTPAWWESGDARGDRW